MPAGWPVKAMMLQTWLINVGQHEHAGWLCFRMVVTTHTAASACWAHHAGLTSSAGGGQ